MTTHHQTWQEFSSKTLNGSKEKKKNLNLQESLAHLHPFQRQHAIELHRQQQLKQLQQPQVQASLSTFTSCTVPASFRARSRFLNLRDSVKKSPTKSNAKVGYGYHTTGRAEIPWVPFTFCKVLNTT